MFTGIVETKGRIVVLDSIGMKTRVEVEVDTTRISQVAIGASVAINGCCLTVVEWDGSKFAFEAVPETLECTTLGQRVLGDLVNVERAMPAAGRFDGHIVQGHIDGMGRVERFERKADDVRLEISCDAEIGRFQVPKGSITIDGVSLTVVDVGPTSFSVALVPHTLEITTLGLLVPGVGVNLEVDILGKYVARYLESRTC